MPSTFTAFIDANVFFGARLRSLMMEVAATGLFRARWSPDVHREWMEAVVERRPDITLADLGPTRASMDAAVPDSLVTGYEALIGGLNLPDPDDRHILAAAILCRADVIVTFNQKDFPAEELARYGIHTRSPDWFFQDVDGLDTGTMVASAARDLAHYKNPPLSVDRYIEDLKKAGVPMLAAYVDRLRVLLG